MVPDSKLALKSDLNVAFNLLFFFLTAQVTIFCFVFDVNRVSKNNTQFYFPLALSGYKIKHKKNPLFVPHLVNLNTVEYPEQLNPVLISRYLAN